MLFVGMGALCPLLVLSGKAALRGPPNSPLLLFFCSCRKEAKVESLAGRLQLRLCRLAVEERRVEGEDAIAVEPPFGLYGGHFDSSPSSEAATFKKSRGVFAAERRVTCMRQAAQTRFSRLPN
jgi:hypothetical protein